MVIRFFDAGGIDISEAAQKKIERLFYREDFRRSLAGEIGDMHFPVRTAEFYTAVLMEHIDVEAVRAARFKVVLDYAYGAASFVMPNVLSKLGAEVLSVNPYASTRQSLTFDRWEHAAQVSELVRASGAHLGAVIDTDGEYITFVDNNGHILDRRRGLDGAAVLWCWPTPTAGAVPRRRLPFPYRWVAPSRPCATTPGPPCCGPSCPHRI